jgi:ketosteroid isomerase-like protein
MIRAQMGMKTHTLPVLLLASLIGLSGCQDLSDSDTAHIKSAIEASVTQATKDWEAFPKSLDRASLLKYYATDYAGVNEGTRVTLKDLGESFDELAEQIKLGSAVGISYKITDLNVQPFTERLALLTYQDQTKVGQGGMVLRDTKQTCSTLVRKDGDTWLVFHEHCSTLP